MIKNAALSPVTRIQCGFMTWTSIQMRMCKFLLVVGSIPRVAFDC